jgi:G6PDH family F420-dependent oxidoreductase
MSVIGWHASHEQIAPSQLLEDARSAEAAGFQAAWSSDHFAPWSSRQGQSGFTYSWLGAAMATTSLPFGMVTAPGQRYHPAIVAQALATLAEMFPERLSAALGSGEFMNEHITGDPWPAKSVRNARLRECVDIIRALLAGDEVTHDGPLEVVTHIRRQTKARCAERRSREGNPVTAQLWPDPLNRSRPPVPGRWRSRWARDSESLDP